jgi:hypothetical protein
MPTFGALAKGPLARLVIPGRMVALKRANQVGYGSVLALRLKTAASVVAALLQRNKNPHAVSATAALNNLLRPTIVKTKQWRQYRKEALSHLKRQYPWRHPVHNGPLHVIVEYWPPDRRSRPDHTAAIDTALDLLRDASIIPDDYYVASTDGSRIRRPRPDSPGFKITVWPYDLKEDDYVA